MSPGQFVCQARNTRCSALVWVVTQDVDLRDGRWEANSWPPVVHRQGIRRVIFPLAGCEKKEVARGMSKRGATTPDSVTRQNRLLFCEQLRPRDPAGTNRSAQYGISREMEYLHRQQRADQCSSFSCQLSCER